MNLTLIELKSYYSFNNFESQVYGRINKKYFCSIKPKTNMIKVFQKILFVLIVTASFVSSLNAQENDLLRVELEVDKNAEAFHVVPVGEEGVLVFCETDERDNQGNKQWVFTKYSNKFKEVWTKEYAVQKSMGYIDFYYAGKNNIYFLLQSSKGYQIMNLDISSGTLYSKFFQALGNYDAEIFKVIDNTAFIAGQSRPNFLQSFTQFFFSLTFIPFFTGATVYPQIPVIQNVELNSVKNQSILTSTIPKSTIIGVELSQEKNINFLLRTMPHRKTAQVYKYAYDGLGNQINTLMIKSDADKDINSGRIMNLGNSNEVIIGTYSRVNPNKRKPLYPGQSNGVYFFRFVDKEQQLIKYYDFSRFESFTSQIKAKSGGFFNRNTNEGLFETKLLIHPVVESNNQFIMLAEAYYPQYHTETYTTYTNGRPMISTRQVFDGYRYTDAIIAGFDKNGDLVWDNHFEMNDVLTYDLKERVKLLLGEDEIALIYSWDGKIKTKIINGKEVVEAKSETDLDNKKESSQVKNNFGSDVAHWYGNYFISFGYQTIKNSSQGVFGGNKKRTIFYFNKIGYQ